MDDRGHQAIDRMHERIDELEVENKRLRVALTSLLQCAENQQETDSDIFEAEKKRAHLALDGGKT
jgi:hypothetical protein